jgi:hypothetical protein
MPGDDNDTRACDVQINTVVPDPKNPVQSKVKSTILRRPIVKLSPLPIY